MSDRRTRSNLWCQDLLHSILDGCEPLLLGRKVREAEVVVLERTDERERVRQLGFARVFLLVLEPHQLQRPGVFGRSDIGLGLGFRGLEMHQHIIEQPNLQLDLILAED